jgi:hypothetical protein
MLSALYRHRREAQIKKKKKTKNSFAFGLFFEGWEKN